MPTVSVLLPCRNASPFLDEAAASIERQTFTDFEVVAVDDGSTDDTRARLDAWAGRDARVRVIAGPHGGIVAALETAAAAARGTLLARMDADDIALPDRIAAQVALLDERPGVAACGTQVRYFPDSIVRDGARRYERWLNTLTAPDAVARDIFIECPIAHPTLLVRRADYERVGGYVDRGWPEDYDLVLRLHDAGARMTNVPRVLHHWRETPDRLSRIDPRYDADAFRRCKAHYLAPRIARRDGVVVCGAGPIGKAFARTLVATGARLRAFVDVDPRKIGQTVYGAPVLPPDRIGELAGALAVAAVGEAAARARIRQDLTARGWAEGADFVAVA